jgi:hypothetical protein
MKTGQMLFVAFGGILLGAGGTLAIQTGLVHYEVTLDIRPRGPLTVPPPNLQAGSNDPYLGPPLAQTWQPAPLSVEAPPLAMPPLDDQEIAEIVTLREQIGPSVSQNLTDFRGSGEAAGTDSFAQHLRAAAGAGDSSRQPPEQEMCPLCPGEGDSLSRGLLDAQFR